MKSNSATTARAGRRPPWSSTSTASDYFRFLCPHGDEMRATVNPRTNLAHCFCCQRNVNNIDLLRELDYDFRSAVALLERWLTQYEAQQRRKRPTAP